MSYSTGQKLRTRWLRSTCTAAVLARSSLPEVEARVTTRRRRDGSGVPATAGSGAVASKGPCTALVKTSPVECRAELHICSDRRALARWHAARHRTVLLVIIQGLQSAEPTCQTTMTSDHPLRLLSHGQRGVGLTDKAQGSHQACRLL